MHYMWSTLESTTEFLDNDDELARRPKLNIPHFDGKAAADKFFPKEKTAFLYTCSYVENLKQQCGQ